MLRASDCPHCEGLKARIEDLERELGSKKSMPRIFSLTRTEESILAMLYGRERVTRDGLMTVLYGLEKLPPEDKVLDVYLCRIRAKLKPFEVSIQTDWGRGWFMRTPDKAKISEWMRP